LHDYYLRNSEYLKYGKSSNKKKQRQWNAEKSGWFERLMKMKIGFYAKELAG